MKISKRLQRRLVVRQTIRQAHDVEGGASKDTLLKSFYFNYNSHLTHIPSKKQIKEKQITNFRHPLKIRYEYRLFGGFLVIKNNKKNECICRYKKITKKIFT